MTSADPDSFPRMIDHWWWRPGWSVGRKFYAWHLTFDHEPDMARLAQAYEEHLALPTLDIIPTRWLHLTMQGVGFVGEVDPVDISKIAVAARERLAKLSPFTVSIGGTVVDPEVVRLRVSPPEQVAELRLALRDAIADVWGDDRVPEDRDDFTPHVSVAYSNGDADMRPILERASAVSPTPATVIIDHADLIELNRDHKQYRWDVLAAVPLGRPV